MSKSYFSNREAARKAGKRSQTVQVYVQSIIRRADELNDQDIEKLRSLLLTHKRGGNRAA